MQNDILISIAIPTYNRPHGLRKVIQNVLNQTYKNVEILISDNASELSNEYDEIFNIYSTHPQFRIFRQEINIGVNNNFKFLFENSKGNYFIWVADDDEFIDNEFIKKLFEKFDDELDLVFPGFQKDSEENDFLDKIYANCVNSESYLLAWLKNGVGFPMYGLFKSSFLKERKIIDILNTKFYFCDSLFLNRVFSEGKVLYDNSVKIYYATSNSATSVVPIFYIRSYLNRMSRSYYYFIKSPLGLFLKLRIFSIILKKDFSYLFLIILQFAYKSIFKSHRNLLMS